MKIFLDIGSHIGQTLHEVTKEKYAFDKIYCFEPSAYCIDELKKIAQKDQRIEICNFGLSNKDQDAELFLAGSVGGTIFKGGANDRGQDHDDSFASDQEVEKVKLRDANKWFEENINPGDYIVVKTNCEGSEVDILDSLIDGDFMGNIYSFLVTFDIRENLAYQHRELEIRKKLGKEAVKNFCFSDDVMVGPTHEKRIENWLSLFGVDTDIHDIELLRNRYQKIFSKYSNKNGFVARWEIRIKRGLSYDLFPVWIKKSLRFVKRIAGLNRERSIR
jgi:FkbM family methyltransferase|tara:strand:+ start:337 stop:1161 length:825 start_codon:yes stop_codon:yes gene_type:complete